MNFDDWMFEYSLHNSDEKSIPNFYKKWRLKNPHEKISENKIKHIWYENEKTGDGFMK